MEGIYMKSRAVKFFKEKGIKRIEGKKVEHYSFYELCGFMKKYNQGEVIKQAIAYFFRIYNKINKGDVNDY